MNPRDWITLGNNCNTCTKGQWKGRFNQYLLLWIDFCIFFFSSVLFSCFGTSLTKPLLWFAKNEFDFFTLILLDSSWDQTQILGIAVTYTGLPVSKKQQPGYVSLLLYMYYSSTYQPLARNKIYGYSAMPMVLSLNPALAGKVLTS